MDIRAMGQRASNHENATRALARRKVEHTLVCPKCGAQNRPGTSYLELDDHDDAWCAVCAHVFAVRIDG